MSYIDEIEKYCETESGPYRRPFTPNQNWSDADVLIIGTNPATPMSEEFDSFNQYWMSLTVDPELYWQRYHAAHSGKFSKSTTNANLLLSLLKPLNVVVTNVVWYPVPKKKLIPKEEWRTGYSALTSLYNYIKPKVVFCHGADAERFGQSIDPNSDRYRPASKQIATTTTGTLVLCFHHFSGQGLSKGAKFQPGLEFPIFAKGIHSHVRA